MADQFLPANIFLFFIVFARVGAMVSVLPGFGEAFVPPRFRLLLALAIALVIMPVVGPRLPAMPSSPLLLFFILLIEIGIGLFLGMAVRILLSTMQIAGSVVAYHSSLANALSFDPASAQQGALTGAFLGTTALLLIFVTDLHHLMLAGIVSSYDTFAAGHVPVIGDLSDTMARLVSRSFILAMQIGAPFVVVGLIFTLSLGLLNRLMPQVQMFFVVMPLQIFVGLTVLMLTVSAMMFWFLGVFEAEIRALFGAG